MGKFNNKIIRGDGISPNLATDLQTKQEQYKLLLLCLFRRVGRLPATLQILSDDLSRRSRATLPEGESILSRHLRVTLPEGESFLSRHLHAIRPEGESLFAE